MSATTEVLAIWTEVRAWLAEARPDLAAELRPGADDELLAELTALGLPGVWRAWWKANDGGGPVLYDGWSWLPIGGVVDSVLSEHDALIEMGTQLAHEPPPSAVGPVRAVWGHRDWIPFAVDYSGRFLCVDLSPLAGGESGQVILVDDDERRVLYDGLKSMLSDCLMRMEMGVHPDDEPDPDTDDWTGEADIPRAPATGSPAPAERPKPPAPPRRPTMPTTPPKPAELSAAPEVRAEAEPMDGGARAVVALTEQERKEGSTVFIRQLGGDIVGVRVPPGAWDGARLFLQGLGGGGADLMLLVSAGG